MTGRYRYTAPAWQPPTGYAATHCRRCSAGWTRIGKEGGVLTVCLLDREPVLADMTSCDRFEAREEENGTELRLAAGR